MTKAEEAKFKAQGELSRAQVTFEKAVNAVLEEKAKEKAEWLKQNGVTGPPIITTNLEHLARIAFDLGKQVGR